MPPLLAIAEPGHTALLLAVVGALLLTATLFSRTVDRLGVPVVLLFLVLGVIAGSETVGFLEFDDHLLAMRLGTLALVLILFDGGLNTRLSAVRASAAPALTLATFGVVFTAGLVAVAARVLGLDWSQALLLGAVVSSTDAAAVFSILRGGGIRLPPKLGGTLELESCLNDPVAVLLTTSLVATLAMTTGDSEFSPWSLLIEIPLQLGIGTVIGLAVGFGGQILLRRATLTTVGLYPTITLGFAMLAFGAATLANGSGFLAVFLAALVLGNGPLPYRNGLIRVHDAVAWLSQIAMFGMLGLLVQPSTLPAVALPGLALGLFLACVARPLAVAACLAPFRFPHRWTAYAGWTGLRGAVPIVLATFPKIAGVPGADGIFSLVFFMVLTSTLVPGATIRWVTKKLGLMAAQAPTPSAVLEMNAAFELDGELTSFHIHSEVAVCGAKLKEISLPNDAAVTLIVRGKKLIPARGPVTLLDGDHAYVIFREEDRGLIELLFGAPEG